MKGMDFTEYVSHGQEAQDVSKFAGIHAGLLGEQLNGDSPLVGFRVDRMDQVCNTAFDNSVYGDCLEVRIINLFDMDAYW
jgi:hypothetical protein